MNEQHKGRRWGFELHKDVREERREGGAGPLPAPLGFNIQSSEGGNQRGNRSATNTRELLKKKAWEVATSPSKSILMTLIMAWLTGGGVNIFSIMFALFTVANPWRSIFDVRNAFARFGELKSELLPLQLIYIALHLATFAIGAYKCYNLGLLPTDTDWAAGLNVKEAMEWSGGGVALQ